MSHNVASHSLDVPGARLHYEVSGSGPVLMLIGLPMDSTGFAQIVPHLTGEYTVVTYDPRGFGQSTIDNPNEDAPPELVADDVSRVLAAVGSEPAYVLGSSGGAVTGVALVTAHPEQVRTLVAHEPPLAQLLPDREQKLAEIVDIYETCLKDGPMAAWPKFFAAAGFSPPPDMGDGEPQPPQDAQPTGDRMLEHCLIPTAHYRPDIAALRAAGTRIVIGGGVEARGQMAYRTAEALAGELGRQLVEFPGDHGGFMSQPEPFALALRKVLGEG